MNLKLIIYMVLNIIWPVKVQKRTFTQGHLEEFIHRQNSEVAERINSRARLPGF